MRFCKGRKCGRMIEPVMSAYEPGKYQMICRDCMLTTHLYDTPEEAEEAWDKGKFTKDSLMIQKRFKDYHDIDDHGAVNLITAVYERAIKDYEAGLKHNPDPAKPSPEMIDVLNLYKRGLYLSFTPGEKKGREILESILKEREEQREKHEPERLKNREYRRAQKEKKARENQAS